MNAPVTRRRLSQAVVLSMLLPLISFLSGCAYYPATVEYYDDHCEIAHRKLVVQESTYGAMRQCENEACVVALLSIPAEYVVVGSLVVVGNVVLWMEKKGRCLLK